ncbi:MAG: biotin--[Ruminococcus sp.]|nr:biotin--[acetyl-CoA-carboxylase] ligase [Ruminococcus sp.]
MKEQILALLAQHDGYISGQALAQALGVSRQAVWKGVRALKDSGCEIESTPNKGYRLTALPAYLNEIAIRRHLHTAVLGKSLVVLDAVGSTNDYLKRMGADGCENGTVVTTREQVAGKGRLGRSWASKRDENLAFSILLRPQLAPKDATPITPLAGLAICKTLRKTTGLDCKIKWPNDVIIGSKKLVGILTEMSAEFDAVEYIVTGIGVNVDQTEFPEEIAHKATSVLLETGTRFDKNRLLAALLDGLEKAFTRYNLSLPPDALEEYTSLCATIGRTVSFQKGTRTLSGTAVEINADGELRVMLQDGSIRTVNSGEVTVQGIY